LNCCYYLCTQKWDEVGSHQLCLVDSRGDHRLSRQDGAHHKHFADTGELMNQLFSYRREAVRVRLNFIVIVSKTVYCLQFVIGKSVNVTNSHK